VNELASELEAGLNARDWVNSVTEAFNKINAKSNLGSIFLYYESILFRINLKNLDVLGS
jgi:hypothetical protein